MSTTQNFTTTGTTFSLEQVAGPPPAQVMSGGPMGNFLRLATMPTSPVVGNDNSISFVTSDPGTWDDATADWDFRVTQISGESGVGMSFALLNTANYGTSGNAASVEPSKGIYDGSLAFGFDTTNNIVYLSLNSAVITGVKLTTLNLASGQFISAQAVVNFQAATVSLVLTPTISGSAVTVFNATSVPGLVPYQSRVSLEAQNSATSFANFDLDNINVVYSGARLPGTISFSSSTYAVLDNQPIAQIEIVRTGGTAGSFTIGFVSADGTARNGVNYEAVSGDVTFGEGQSIQIVDIPIINDHLDDGNKTVNLYIKQYSHVQRSHRQSDRGHVDDRQYQSASSDGLAQGPARLRGAYAHGDGISLAFQPADGLHQRPDREQLRGALAAGLQEWPGSCRSLVPGCPGPERPVRDPVPRQSGAAPDEVCADRRARSASHRTDRHERDIPSRDGRSVGNGRRLDRVHVKKRARPARR